MRWIHRWEVVRVTNLIAPSHRYVWGGLRAGRAELVGGRDVWGGGAGIEGSAAVSCIATSIDLLINIFNSVVSFTRSFAVFWGIILEDVEGNLVAVVTVLVVCIVVLWCWWWIDWWFASCSCVSRDCAGG